jgi:hypothetical protein
MGRRSHNKEADADASVFAKAKWMDVVNSEGFIG